MQTGYTAEQWVRHLPGVALVVSRDNSLIAINNPDHPLIIPGSSSQAYVVAELFRDAQVSVQVQQILSRVFAEGAIDELLQFQNDAGECRQAWLRCYPVENEIAVCMLGDSVCADHEPEANPAELLEKRNNLLMALNSVTVRMMDHQSLPSLLQNVAQLTLELTNACSSFIHIVGGRDAYLELTAIAGTELAPLGQRLTRGQGLAGKAWQTGVVEYVEDYQSLPERLQSIGTTTQACALPMVVGDRVVGVLGIMYDDFREAIVDQLDLIQQFARLASIAVHNATLMEQTRNELVRNRTMNELGSAVFESDDFTELLDITVQAILNIVEHGSIDFWRVEKGDVLTRIAGWRIAEGEVESIGERDDEGNRAGVLRWLRSVAGNTFTDEAATALPQLIGSPIQSTESHYIGCRGETSIWAVFHVQPAEESILSDNIVNLLDSVGKQFSIAAFRQRLQRRVKHQAYHDGLTTLPNRTLFDLSLKDAVASGLASSGKFAVLFIDLDGFKMVTDPLGHETGDRLLVEVAQRFRRELSAEWTLARIGGDEFAVVAELSGEEHEIDTLANRLLASLVPRFLFDGHSPKVGASIGVSMFPEDGVDASELLRHADMAMYEAKRGGKNRYCLFAELEKPANRPISD